MPSLFWGQVGYWLLFWLMLAVPFFTGASAIGLGLMAAGDQVARVYGANLLGSGVGCVVATVAMNVLPPAWLPVLMGGLALPAAVAIDYRSLTRRIAAMAIPVAAMAGWVWACPPDLRIDPYKYLAYVQRLERQGSAQRVAAAFGSRSTIELYRSDAFHDLPFLSFGLTPPPVDSVVVDGHCAGSLLRIDRLEEAAVVDQTLMAFPYALLPTHPRVLLLGEIDGLNIWLALRQSAREIRVVQPDRKLTDLLRSRPGSEGGGVLNHPGVFDQPGVSIVTRQPRHFVEHNDDRFDLIQLVTLQSVAAGSAGMAGLAEDHLITVEGITACLHRLNADGLLVVCRGIQTPPRDNVKLLATFIAALRRLGVQQPETHVVLVRDFLAVCTLVKRSAWDERQVAQLRELCGDRQLTPVWFTGIRPDELNWPDVLPGPADGPGDWYHHAAVQLFSPRAAPFMDDYVYDVRPATDDRPFFGDFFKLRSLAAFREVFGDLWLTRTELAFLFVLTAAAVVTVVGAMLTVVPLLLLRDVRHAAGRSATVLYFAAIGLAYLLLEMTVLSRMTHLLGDPVLAAALTISTFLTLSGLGSLLAQRIEPGRSALLRTIDTFIKGARV